MTPTFLVKDEQALVLKHILRDETLQGYYVVYTNKAESKFEMLFEARITALDGERVDVPISLNYGEFKVQFKNHQLFVTGGSQIVGEWYVPKGNKDKQA